MKIILLCLSLTHALAHADLDQHQQQGLKDTQRLLTSPGERNAAIGKDKKALDVDKKVDALTGGGKNKEEIYDIASQVMEVITKEADGDPEKMQKLLREAEVNPQAFYNHYFSDADKSRVRNLATDIEKNKSSLSSPR